MPLPLKWGLAKRAGFSRSNCSRHPSLFSSHTGHKLIQSRRWLRRRARGLVSRRFRRLRWTWVLLPRWCGCRRWWRSRQRRWSAGRRHPRILGTGSRSWRLPAGLSGGWRGGWRRRPGSGSGRRVRTLPASRINRLVGPQWHSHLPGRDGNQQLRIRVRAAVSARQIAQWTGGGQSW